MEESKCIFKLKAENCKRQHRKKLFISLKIHVTKYHLCRHLHMKLF